MLEGQRLHSKIVILTEFFPPAKAHNYGNLHSKIVILTDVRQKHLISLYLENPFLSTPFFRVKISLSMLTFFCQNQRQLLIKKEVVDLQYFLHYLGSTKTHPFSFYILQYYSILYTLTNNIIKAIFIKKFPIFLY